MLKVGDELGRYEIIAHLKNGGMASLYLGRRRIPPDNRIFAIKVVHPHFLDDEDLVQMFEDEAKLSLRIHHSNVVHVEEVGEADGQHFLAMEYVHGCSVAQLLQALIRRRRRMSPELAIHIAMRVCEGLHAAHSLCDEDGHLLNVVHRDISPQNVLLAHTGELRLIDFGIAKSRARMHHSATGSSIRGKLRYMSPEHAKGQSVDARTDIYAVGIVLWEMLTMRPLFWGDTDFEVLTRVQDPVVDPPSTYAPSITPAIDDAVLIALSPQREARPATALDFRDLLARACPAALALKEERVSELLHAVLGEEMVRVADRMPEEVSVRMGLDSTSTTTLGQKKARPPAVVEQALETLTDPSGYDAVLAERFVKSEPTPSGLHELLGAASVELMEEATSTTIDANSIADYLSQVSSPTITDSSAPVARPVAPPAPSAFPRPAAPPTTHPDMSAINEPDDPTEQLSRTALAKIHDSLAEVARRRQRVPDPDGETLDERPPVDMLVASPTTISAMADEASDVSTIDEKRPVLPRDPVTEELEIDDIISATASEPPGPVTTVGAPRADDVSPAEYFSGSTDVSPTPVFAGPPPELDAASLDELPSRPSYGDSEPPTTVYDPSQHPRLAPQLADRLALAAGAAVAVLVLATLAGYLLF